MKNAYRGDTVIDLKLEASLRLSEAGFMNVRILIELALQLEQQTAICNELSLDYHHVEQRTIQKQSYAQDYWIFEREAIFCSSFVAGTYSVERYRSKL